MRHVAPVIRAILVVRRSRRVVDEAIHPRRAHADDIREVVDVS